MNVKKIIILIALYVIAIPSFAATPDPKYCKMLAQLSSGMNISDVFLLLGPPHTFGQPPDLNINAVKNPTPNTIQPQNSISENTPETRARIAKSMAEDPILGSFINAPADYTNVLIWEFEKNTLSVAVKVKGPIVTDVKANFTCK